MEDFATRFTLNSAQSGPFRVLSANNDWPLPVTVELTISGDNVEALTGPTPDASSMKLKTLHVLPAYCRGVVLAALRPAAPAAPWTMNYSFRGAMVTCCVCMCV